MRYQQYRIAKRNGEIVQQCRYATSSTKNKYPWWQFWNWSIYEVSYDYTEWEDIPMVELNVLAGAEHHSDKGYAESTHEKQAEFARKRNRSTNV